MKYFIISLHRTGTRSTDQFFSDQGLKTIHWPAEVAGTDYQAMIQGRETDLEFVVRTLEPVTDGHDALSDLPYPGLYRQLASRYEDAKFVLCYRNAFDWVRSVRQHYERKDGTLAPFARVLYWQHFPEHPLRLNDISDREMLRMHAQHFADAIEFFSIENWDRLGVFNLDGDDLGEKLAAFAGFSQPESFPRRGGRYQGQSLRKFARKIARAASNLGRKAMWSRQGNED